MQSRSLKTLQSEAYLFLLPNTTTTMRASASSSLPAKLSSPFIPAYFLSSRRRSVVPIIISKKPLFGNLRFASSGLRVFASIAERRALEPSWFSSDLNSGDEYGGWTISDTRIRNYDSKQGFPIFLISGGALLACLVSAIAYLSLSKKGQLDIGFKFRIPSPVDELQNIVDSRRNESITIDYDESDGHPLVKEPSSELESDASHKNVTSEKVKRTMIPIPLDSTEREALSVLKKLKIIEDEVKADELCTRREYCRWLVRLNSLLERDPRHRIIPFESLSGSTKAAFNDVSVEDIDFASIQALAEAGVVSSMLSQKSSYNGLVGRDVCFSPERFVSRLDLIDWKSQLDYGIGQGMTDQMMTTKVGFMDMKGTKLDASPGFYKDMLAEDNCIIRKVFGQSKRFQPNKPSTKAQAAVALTSGRMAAAISNELSRLEAESSARQTEMEAIWSEFVETGDIKRLWDEKLNEEKACGVEVEKAYLAAVTDLEKEKVVQEKHFVENLKKKVAMDCQRQLLLSLNEEVNYMSEKLASERSSYVAEKCSLREMLSDLESKLEGMLDTKSILEAEIGALHILRSWVEEEARKSQARAKVLEEVGRRWKWDDQS